MSGLRFVFAVFCFAGILILAVYLRSAKNRIFYQVCLEEAEQNRLNEDLGQKQLRLESLINPPGVSQRLGE